MSAEQPQGRNESQQVQIEALSTQVAATQTDIDALQMRADKATKRANTSEQIAYAESRRVDQLEERVDVHEALIAALQAEGSLRRGQAAQLEQALRSSRIIGAAIGIIMARLNVGDVEAFRTLNKASQDSNRKLRVIAEEVVRTKGVNALTGAATSSVDAVQPAAEGARGSVRHP
jgi:hypothetical protein